MAVDGVGLLYIGDENRRDVQVWDFRGNNAVALTQPMRPLGLSDLKAIDVAADGLLLMAGSGGCDACAGIRLPAKACRFLQSLYSDCLLIITAVFLCSHLFECSEDSGC